MKTEINSPSVSKINWTAIVIQLVTIAFLAGLIPLQYQTAVIALIGLVLPALVQIFRSKFTDPAANK